METTRKSVYPVHKLDVFDPDYLKKQTSESTDIMNEYPDFRINKHYFDMVLPEKPKKKAGFKNISKPHEVSKHTIPIRQDEYVIRESKIDFLTKLGKFEDMNDSILDKINGLFK